ncbi:MAG: hypothetical protein RRY19_09850, partial [Clostridium sp.]
NYILNNITQYDVFISGNMESDIRIEIEKKTKEYLNYTSLLSEKNKKDTYAWINYKQLNIMCFGERGKTLNMSQENEIWYLICNEDYSKCKLVIDEDYILNNEKIGCQIFNRPWLQRLYNAYVGLGSRFIMHGACISLDNKNGMILLGDSGAGKSTACEIVKSTGNLCISDDRVIVEIIDDKLYCYASPWNIKNPHLTNNKKLRVEKILFLYHGNNEYKSIDKFNEFCKNFSKQIIHSNIYSKQSVLKWKIEKSIEAYNITQSYKVEFTPDKSFLKLIKVI